MTGNVLHVWADHHHVGVFHRSPTGHVSFRYDTGTGMPLSLSLPRNGRYARLAPTRFLENLLPDDESARRRMAARLHVDSTDTFTLLGGADTVGGLTFTISDRLPDRPVEVSPLSDDDIARQIDYSMGTGYQWFARDPDDEFAERTVPRCRFSIAGGQPKFTLARRGGVWLWPNLMIPSTHIFKPMVRDCPDSDLVEDMTMTLAGSCGLPVTEHGVWRHDGVHAFVTRRFDRTIRDGRVCRVHCEDLAQAMGVGPEAKYEVTATSCVRFLHRFDPSDGMGYEWVRRLAFNVASADCDAHGKNYSIMLSDRGFRFAPMYDLTVTRAWPHMDHELAMPVNGVEYAELLTPRDWAAFAVDAGLDEERVVHLVRTMAGSVLRHVEQASNGLPRPVRDMVLKAVEQANGNIQPLDESTPPTPMPVASFDSGRAVWVSPHIRNGYAVSGYWRSR